MLPRSRLAAYRYVDVCVAGPITTMNFPILDHFDSDQQWIKILAVLLFVYNIIFHTSQLLTASYLTKVLNF